MKHRSFAAPHGHVIPVITVVNTPAIVSTVSYRWLVADTLYFIQPDRAAALSISISYHRSSVPEISTAIQNCSAAGVTKYSDRLRIPTPVIDPALLSTALLRIGHKWFPRMFALCLLCYRITDVLKRELGVSQRTIVLEWSAHEWSYLVTSTELNWIY